MNPPTGERHVRVLRITSHSEPITHPTDPNMDSWLTSTETRVLWVREDAINPTDTRLDLV